MDSIISSCSSSRHMNSPLCVMVPIATILAMLRNLCISHHNSLCGKQLIVSWRHYILVHCYSSGYLSLSVAVEALRQFLACSESTIMLDRLEQDNVWALLEKEDTCPVGMLYTAR